MELRQLEYFAAVAEDGTYTAAASRLRVAQPALWKQVHELERELGVALFERVGRGVRITTTGELLLERANQVLTGSRGLRALAEDLRLGRRGRVRVGCFAPHIVSFLAPVVSTFGKAHPEIDVELVEHGLSGASGLRPQTSLHDSLKAGAVDVVTTSFVDDDDLDGFPAYAVRVVAVPTPGGKVLPARKGRRSLTIASLRDVPLVVSPRGYYSRERLEAACRLADLEPRIECESSSPAALLALAEQGVGTAIVADDAVPTHAFLTLSFEGKALGDTVWLYRHVHRRGDPAVDAFFETARQAAQR